MRVTNASTYRNFTTSVNNVHLALNKSMNKVSSGEAYENAAANPLAYYEGQKMDHQYQSILSKKTLLKDVQNRIYQQELGARDIQSTLAKAKNQVQYARTATTTDTALDSTKADLLQKQHEIVNTLNGQYQDFYIYGGNDVTTAPFSLSADGTVLTYSHTFPGESNVTSIEMTLTKQTDGSYAYEITNSDNLPASANGDPKAALLQAMKEQGRIDIGYGSIQEHDPITGVRDTLLDTYTGGLNVLTGLTSNAVQSGAGSGASGSDDDILTYLTNSSLGMIGQAVQAINDFQTTGDKATMVTVLGNTITDMTQAEHAITAIYSDLGNRYRLLDDMDDRLDTIKGNLEEEYKEKLGADPYASIVEMYSNQYAYNAALQVGSKLMSSSLFDFVG